MKFYWIPVGLIGLNTLVHAVDISLREQPNHQAKIIDTLSKSDDIEVTLGPWLYVKNHSKNTSGWIKKQDFETALGTHFNYSERFSNTSHADQVKAMQKQHRKMMHLWQQQEQLFRNTEALLEQFILDDANDTSKVSDT